MWWSSSFGKSVSCRLLSFLCTLCIDCTGYAYLQVNCQYCNLKRLSWWCIVTELVIIACSCLFVAFLFCPVKSFKAFQSWIWCYHYFRQWNEVHWSRLWDWSIHPCVSVCLCTRIGGDMHSNERLLVYYCYLMLLYFYSIFISVIYSFYLPCNRIVYMCDSLNAITTKLNLYHRFSFFFSLV